MKIFITGTSGFVGLSLIEDLLKEKHEVYGLIQRQEAMGKIKKAGVIPVMGDLRRTGQFSQILKGMDMLIHLGALIKFSSDFDIFYKINVEATKQLINHAIEQGVRKFIYVCAAAIELNEDPPITTIIVHFMGTEFTIDDSKIRNELGYNDVMSVAGGLKQLNKIHEVVNMGS